MKKVYIIYKTNLCLLCKISLSKIFYILFSLNYYVIIFHYFLEIFIIIIFRFPIKKQIINFGHD